METEAVTVQTGADEELAAAAAALVEATLLFNSMNSRWKPGGLPNLKPWKCRAYLASRLDSRWWPGLRSGRACGWAGTFPLVGGGRAAGLLELTMHHASPFFCFLLCSSQAWHSLLGGVSVTLCGGVSGQAPEAPVGLGSSQ